MTLIFFFFFSFFGAWPQGGEAVLNVGGATAKDVQISFEHMCQSDFVVREGLIHEEHRRLARCAHEERAPVSRLQPICFECKETHIKNVESYVKYVNRKN